MSDWKKIDPPICDCCNRPAIFKHPSGGLRCGRCPRPTGPALPWVQCTSVNNNCLGGCATRAEHERYNKPKPEPAEGFLI